MPGASLIAASALAATGLLCLWLQRGALRGTTLLAPWCWSVVSLVALTSAELAAAFSTSAGDPTTTALRYVAAMSTFCPLMALLGAKRPQDAGWQFIVLSLWVVLALPGLEWLLFGGVQELHPARVAFLVLLIAIGAINGVGTRLMPASLLFAAGQGALVAPFLGLEQASSAREWLPPAGMAALVASWAVATARRIVSQAPRPLDRVWLDFRDAYGLVWSLRAMERVNATGKLCMWPTRLGWRGFYRVDSPLPSQPGDDLNEATLAAVVETLRTLLRRFVSAAWIENRLGSLEKSSARAGQDETASVSGAEKSAP
ncbi:MAG TPA: hypothetical protein VL175_10635 [Pirellulales bacterium]|jgi:hypothetical protein|nr:hypothetical protein [Pirellulales bacterium]